jgi:tRNA nucleotidyltransferase (CCA-adding enzyme)
MHIPLPAPVEKTLTTLQSAGYDTYVVGGCVRDSMLGLIPPDWDISPRQHPRTSLRCLAAIRSLKPVSNTVR